MPEEPVAASAEVQICGHRGHSAGAPENTLPALEAAAARGAVWCEVDVVLTRDEEIVLLHDEILDRTTNGRGAVGDLDLAAVRSLDAGSWRAPRWAGTPVPTLDEALAAARSLGLSLLIEIKERRRVEPLIARLGAALRAADAVADHRVISFDHPSLLRVRERIPGVGTEIITHARHVDIVAVARAARADSVSLEWDMFAAEDARALHAAGIAVRVTVPRPERLALLAAYGLDPEPRLGAALAAGLVDVLAGDDVDALCALVERHARRARSGPRTS